MRGFCPPRQKYRGDFVLADQIAGILCAMDCVRREFSPGIVLDMGLLRVMFQPDWTRGMCICPTLQPCRDMFLEPLIVCYLKGISALVRK